MSTNVKIKRVHLNVNQTDESSLIGIVSAEPDYKLSLALNKKLKISLRNVSPISFSDINGTDLTFSRFSDISAAPDLTYNLTSNRYGKNFLIRKLKNIDYIFQINNYDNETDINNIISMLRDTECVTAAFNIDLKSLKDKNLQYIIQ